MEYVWLELKRNRGNPWPEASLGLDPMYGPEGWCRGCGIPLVPQQGSLVLSRTARSKFDGAWVPYWRYNELCVDEQLARSIAEAGLNVELVPIEWRGPGGSLAFQIKMPVAQGVWFSPAELTTRTVAKHGSAGQSCDDCGIFRWYPLDREELPQATISDGLDVDISASPEWFGDGLNSYHEFLVSRTLADMLVAASQRDFYIIQAKIGLRGR
ncbi:hypothetical protein [Kribbella sp. CA-293567]|uniref:hypothetical protein n=1 Tax=Kribbella sp. CA-293567 TaxID=3002436 RepID=UPI0022DD3FA6|nr:hypothetical protein [Kribbella sp. CA-293567]WBQ07743.1 hypothetical protein OX958_13295 [Kribbella sp. CA-293567]